MGMTKMWGGAVVCAAALLAGCGDAPVDEVAQQRQALVPDGFLYYLSAPLDGYVSSPVGLGGVVSYQSPDPSASLSDVGMKLTVKGAFDPGMLWTHAGLFSCTAEHLPGISTITCNAASLPGWAKDGFNFDAIPTGEGTLDVALSVSVGGVEVGSDSRTVLIHPNSGADLNLWSWGGGTANVGQPTYTGFFASNNGPGSATGSKVTLALDGPGKFLSVSVPWWYSPTPASCEWTDTTATCDLGQLNRWEGYPIDVVFEGSATGWLTIDGAISGNEDDPAPYNNNASAWYQVIQPTVADLSISITDAPDPALVKKALTYTIAVKNNGPDASTGATVMDSLPPNVTFVSATSTQGSCWGGEWGWLDCQLGPIAAGAGATVTVVVKPNEGGTIANQAYVWNWAYDELDPNFENNFAMATTTVKGPNPPVVTTTKTDHFPIDAGFWVPCANDFVVLSGELHVSSHTAYNKSTGRYQYSAHVNPSNMKGTGVQYGTSWVATGSERYSHKFENGLPPTFSYTNSFQLISQGSLANLRVKVVSRVSFGSDGSVKHVVDKYDFICQ